MSRSIQSLTKLERKLELQRSQVNPFEHPFLASGPPILLCGIPWLPRVGLQKARP